MEDAQNFYVLVEAQQEPAYRQSYGRSVTQESVASLNKSRFLQEWALVSFACLQVEAARFFAAARQAISWYNRFHLETAVTKRNHKMGYTTARFSSSSYTTACFSSSISQRVKQHQDFSNKKSLHETLYVFSFHTHQTNFDLTALLGLKRSFQQCAPCQSCDEKQQIAHFRPYFQRVN